ncbi:MAG: alpha/beta hydrolase [Dehalococcoidia bacterium]|nr:alpha/beta hydrolase [Dehalococcoidia bacterium]
MAASMSEPVDGYLTARGIRLHYLDWGGAGPPLLLLHGLASNAHIWDLTAPYLASRFRALAVDQRGHGRSDKPDGEDAYTFAEVTADLAALVAALGLGRPVVAGHSWGGGVAAQFAADHPRLAAAIVLVDGGFAQLSSAEGMTWEKAEEMMRPPDIDGVKVDVFLRMARLWPDVKDIWSEQLGQMILTNFEIVDGRIYRRLPIAKHMKIVRAIWDQDTSGLWQRIECPVLMVPAISSDSAARPGWNERKLQGIEDARGKLRDATVHVMTDTIHDIPVQRPRELAEAIIGFAARLA